MIVIIRDASTRPTILFTNEKKNQQIKMYIYMLNVLGVFVINTNAVLVHNAQFLWATSACVNMYACSATPEPK